MNYLGDFSEDETVYVFYTTNDGNGGRVSFSAALETADFEVIKDGNATGSVAGITLDEDFDSRTGVHKVTIDLSADAFYATGSDYALLLYPDETVDSQSIAAVVASWSIENRHTAAGSSPPSAADIVNEWETQSQADPTGFHVNVMEVNGTAQTANDNGADINTLLTRLIGTIAAGTHTAQTGDSFARIGATGSGLTTLATQASVNTIDDYIDTEIAALTSELAKVPKSDGTATWNATALAAIETQCDDAITANTLILDIPTNAELASAVANVSVDEIQASALADLFNTDSGTDYASAVEGSVVSEIADNAGGSALTAGGIADAVWDEVLDVAHEDAGSASVLLQGAGSAGDPWATALPGSYGAGTAGKIIGDNINAPLSTIDTVVDGIQTDLSNGTDGLGALKTLIDACSTHSAADVWSVAARVLTAGTNLENLSAADVAAELETYDAVKRSEATTDTGTITTAIASAFTEIKGDTWSDTTDTLEHIRNKQTDIETDTAEIGVAGAGLTAINLPNQTMNITGNLSGSVGSVTDGVTLADNAITSAKYDESTAFPLTAVNGSTLTEAGGTGDQFTGIPKTGYSLAADQSAVTIGTVTNLTNAPTSGDLTATMKASINTEVDTALNTSTISSPTAGSIADYVMRTKYVICNKFTIDSSNGESVVHNDSNVAVSTVPGAFTEASTIKTRLKVY